MRRWEGALVLEHVVYAAADEHRLVRLHELDDAEPRTAQQRACPAGAGEGESSIRPGHLAAAECRGRGEPDGKEGVLIAGAPAEERQPAVTPQIERGAANALAALGLLVAFQIAMTWVGMYLGLVVGKEETASQAGIMLLPVTSVFNVFVPTGGMPAWLRANSDWNPISAVAAAERQLFGNPAVPAGGSWPLEHPITATLGWTVLLLAVFVPLCTVRYARR